MKKNFFNAKKKKKMQNLQSLMNISKIELRENENTKFLGKGSIGSVY